MQTSVSALPRLDQRDALVGQLFGPRIMMNIASLLNQAHISNVLWGNSMIDIYGVPTIDIDMSFVVDRSQVHEATSLLSYAGLQQCMSEDCYPEAPPASHFHLPEVEQSMFPDLKPSVQFHIRDQLLGGLGLEFRNPTFTDEDNIIFASDGRLPKSDSLSTSLGKGRHPTESPVRILTPERYAEALVLLSLRDRDTDACITWETQINYLSVYKLVNLKKVNSFCRDYLGSPLNVSQFERWDRAQEALNLIANKGHRSQVPSQELTSTGI
ncbi:MAG: hypothetical protein M1837_004905 [Sclerophora amabilis]|nr:MAG: hypothetical protein M1837_004905 [Sclerophora amabilis]